MARTMPSATPRYGAGEDHLVDRLDRLTGTDRADVGDRPAHGGQDGPRSLDIGASPPTKIVSVAFLAPSLPPTRAIDHRQVAIASALGEVPAADGAIVEQSTISVPARAPSTTPSGPNRTASTSGVSDDADDRDLGSATAAAGVSAMATPRGEARGATRACGSSRSPQSRPGRGWPPCRRPWCRGRGRRRASLGRGLSGHVGLDASGGGPRAPWAAWSRASAPPPGPASAPGRWMSHRRLGGHGSCAAGGRGIRCRGVRVPRPRATRNAATAPAMATRRITGSSPSSPPRPVSMGPRSGCGTGVALGTGRRDLRDDHLHPAFGFPW
jgi:hypothetical protein